ncbi:peptidoglycan/xylan/chitin deacetylase (PgdA/CDA1 family) [Arthrobacter sp. 1088]|uniref:polysaccharide deacetylase family protein n=1 Tax=Arthrobacter sp. 1088 TaxID=2817768 RepID=UPI002856174A|nr:polysaccharide deacetylase [Arthrobacter sp. 1088]MDR6685382.1 peptidoglycan/xylan/chitin deacetylase (PgdA/CDA1 family) [Arthrobacter sp. 1088]
MNHSEPWEWPEPQWRGHVNKIRAGQSLLHPDPAARWKDGAKVAVLLSFDSDHETPSLRDGETSPGRMAQGEYGARVAVPRILELLRRYEAPASFYIPAVCALLRPEEIPRYVDNGHEVGVHGWIHERNTLLTYEQELDLLGRATDVLHKQSGTKPAGIRTPSWDFSDSTLEVVQELGFLYDSSLMADDEPYELLAEGSQTGIIEIPVDWIRDDAPYLMMDRYSGLRPYMPPRQLTQIWKDEFDAAYAANSVFQLTLHPHIIGHRSRLIVLEELMEYIRSHDGVWITTHQDLATHVASRLTTRTSNS